ncbi:hypothetical protein PACTADRAFT_4634 [Pachysolen tannophilus NRRL Y-2460]|uniref:Histidinol-phosphatase n=1 Tax=Pachysolen tannophilus NRRL Y-2460 TaxID=669874 RepID=A0A1E4TPQ3_PACTA|nr:hypothetical protein PACTADRAFT_4634 [Pachysolen tannophilus NRRL Y-2460]
MHSHHSHSGDYIAHASDSLEDIVNHAISLKFQIFCLTEHMPRYDLNHLYPEELDKNYNCCSLIKKFNDYYKHALDIKARVNHDKNINTKILVGIETEGGLTPLYLDKILEFKSNHAVDLIIGSIHHVNEIPIDFDRRNWVKARESCNGSTRELFKTYFELQYQLLVKLKPEVIGHFDLIRLMLINDDLDIDSNSNSNSNSKQLDPNFIEKNWPDVWEIIIKNIKFIVSYGGLIELNSAAIRKGWDTPYPQRDIVKVALELNAKFCLSDDSHGIRQVALNYGKVLNYCKEMKINTLYYLDLNENNQVFVNSISLDEAQRHPFWLQLDKTST